MTMIRAGAESRISESGLTPAPRCYPPGVALVRRSARGAAAAPGVSDVPAIEQWLLRDAAGEKQLLELVESFAQRVVIAGIPVDRLTLHMGTLHPQLVGFGWVWNSADQLCDEVKVPDAIAATDSFLRNPIPRVRESGEAVRRNPQTPGAAEEFPILAELARDGIADYLVLPLSGEGRRNVVTISTRRASGFSDAELQHLRRLLELFALHVERHAETRISSNALTAYLGAIAAEQVLSGAIKRGTGKAISAVIWVSDLRGFTRLSDQLSPADLIEVLNAYFDVAAGAVLAHGGEVLKFIGDGLLGVFRIAGETPGPDAAARALAAATEADSRMGELNDRPPPHLAAIADWRPLKLGIALHEGEVFFGNIGSPERLDFTVIGPAVNEASRVEALQKVLGRTVLITGSVARHLDCPLDHLGEHTLRGVSAPVSIYSPAKSVSN